MKKKIIPLVIVLAMVLGGFTPATVHAGVTDGESGGTGTVNRTTTTNYFTKIVLNGTFTDVKTGDKTNFTRESDEVPGNYDSGDLTAIIDQFKDEFSQWAQVEGREAKNISFDKGSVTVQQTNVHDEITQENVVLSDVILVGDVDDLDSAYAAGGPITINTITEVHQTFTITAKADNQPKIVTYNLKDEYGNIISFKEEEGRVLAFTMEDVLQISDEVLAEAGITKDMFNSYMQMVKDGVKKQGNLISLYQIFIHDDGVEVHEAKSSFKIRIKKTAEMKKYNTFKLTYFDDEFKAGKTIELEDKGDYLEVELPHLSFYALTGTNEAAKNPNTADNFAGHMALMVGGILGVIGAVALLKKR